MKNVLLTHRRITQYAIVCLTCCLILSSCARGFLTPHRVTVQQGNIVTQKLFEQLEIGMTKEQVQYILGSPLVVGSFNHDQWNYIYRLRDGDNKETQKNLLLTFSDEKLSGINGDFVASPKETSQKETTQEEPQTDTPAG